MRLAFRLILFFCGVVTSVFVSSLATLGFEASQPSEIKEAELFWSGLDDLRKSHNVKYSITTRGVVRRGEAKSSGRYSVVRSLSDKEQVEFRNDTYSATLVRDRVPGSSWGVRWIGKTGEFDKSAVFSDMFNMQVADPAGLSSILKYNLYSRIEVNPNNREYVIYVSDAVPANSGVHSHYSKAIFRVSGDLDSYPTKIEITSTDGMVSVSEYSDFVTLSGTEVPQSVRVTLAGDSDGSDQYRFDYLEIDSQFDHDECFLTYYGFPEPDGEPEFPWRWFMLAGFIVCSSLLLFVGKRQQYFNRKTKQEV